MITYDWSCYLLDDFELSTQGNRMIDDDECNIERARRNQFLFNLTTCSLVKTILYLGLSIVFVCLMVFNATFNNISVILWRSVLLVEETGENHRPVASNWQTLSHNVVHLARPRFVLTTSVVIGTDCICSCKSNYHTIMATTAQLTFCNDISSIK